MSDFGNSLDSSKLPTYFLIASNVLPDALDSITSSIHKHEVVTQADVTGEFGLNYRVQAIVRSTHIVGLRLSGFIGRNCSRVGGWMVGLKTSEKPVVLNNVVRILKPGVLATAPPERPFSALLGYLHSVTIRTKRLPKN
jgi:hypothetical protein